jgi:hypothetical protein
MGILRTDRVSGLGGANAITGSTFFGNSSSNSNGNYLRVGIDSTEDFAFGTGDFTIEFWFNRVLSTHQQHFYDFRGSSNTNRLLVYMVNNVMYYFGSGSERITSGTVPSGEWVHFALVRSSASTKMYFNGTQTGSTFSDSINFVGPDRGSGFIGSNGGSDGITPSGSFLSAHLSNFRVQKGKAEYTAAFTPPTHRLEKTPETVLLTCNSPGDVTNEETGKVVTPSSLNINSKGPEASRFTPNSPVGFSTTTDVGTQFGSTFDGVTTFDSQAYFVPPGGNARERNRGRGLVGGGWNNPSLLAQIYSVEIQSDGASSDFGDLTDARRGTGAVASHTRAVWGGGYSPGYVNVMDFVTIANSADALDFGDLDNGRFESSGVSNDTRGVFGPCENPSVSQNVIQFITIATTGNAQDFGDSTVQTKKQASMCSTTRGLFAGGQQVPSPSNFFDIIDQITIASTGNATDFGDLLAANFMCTGVSDSTRGVIGGGNGPNTSGANFNVIQFVTIASAGNATDFGDLTTANQRSGGMSNSVRGLFSGGATPDSSTSVNSIDKITIQTTGNAVDFGDYIGTAVTQAAGCSDSHGGLS